MDQKSENIIEQRLAEASEKNSRLLGAVDEIDFSSRKAITNGIFRRMLAFKIAFGWPDLKICYECGVVHVTLKSLLGDEMAARDLWDAAKIAYTTRLTDLAEKTIESVMNGEDENARAKAAMFVLERRHTDYAKKDGDAETPAGARVLLAQQIVVKIVDKSGAGKRPEIEGATVDQAEVGFEPADAIGQAFSAGDALSCGMIEVPGDTAPESAA